MKSLPLWTLGHPAQMTQFLILFALAFSAPAAAQECTTLVYQGAPQSYILKDNGASPSYNPPIVGTVTLTAPLVPNLTNAAVTPTAWDFSTSHEGLNSASSMIGLTSSFVFSTDAQGNITTWNFGASYGGAATHADVYGTSTPSVVTTGGGNGTPYPGTYYDGVGKTDTSVLPPVFFYTLSVAIGSWYCLAPLVDPLNAQVATLSAQNAAFTTQLATAQATIDSDHKQIASLNTTIVSLQTQIVSLQAQLKAAQAVPAATPTPAVQSSGGGGAMGWGLLLGLLGLKVSDRRLRALDIVKNRH